LQTGDKVIYSKFAGTDLDVAGEAHVLLKVRSSTLPQVAVAAAAQGLISCISEPHNVSRNRWVQFCQAATV
jgi:hypothetical protein